MSEPNERDREIAKEIENSLYIEIPDVLAAYREEIEAKAKRVQDEAWCASLWPENPEGAEPITPEFAKDWIKHVFAQQVIEAKREGAREALADCPHMGSAYGRKDAIGPCNRCRLERRALLPQGEPQGGRGE